MIGLNLGHLADRAGVLAPALLEIFRLISDGTFDPVVDKSFLHPAGSGSHFHRA